jgi:hypothetical protein
MVKILSEEGASIVCHCSGNESGWRNLFVSSSCPLIGSL